MAAPVIDLFTGDLPLRSHPLTYSVNKEEYLTWEVPMIGQMNTSVSFVNDKAVAAQSSEDNSLISANESAISASASAAAGNYKGLWDNLTGAQSQGISVSHDGATWRLNENVADVTLEEPTPTNTNWSFTSGTRWIQPTVLIKNSQSLIVTTAPTDKALPVLLNNDFIYIKNSATSSHDLRLINGTYTILSEKGSLSSGDNLILRVGEAVSFVALNPTTLEIVK